MRRAAIIILSLVGAGAAWTALASMSLCWAIQRHDLFVFPFNQWWALAPLWFGANWYATIVVITSTVLPGMGVGVALIAVAALTWKRSKQPSLYGDTAWATQKEMSQGKIGTHKRPF